MSARVYIANEQLPPHPGEGWTRFVCISDTHSARYSLPSGDVLLHAGDLCSWGTFKQLTTTVEWLKAQEHPVKIVIAGNHDICLDSNARGPLALTMSQNDVQAAQAYIRGQAGLHYLEHESLVFTSPSSGRKWTVYGSPATPVHFPGAFQYKRDEEATPIYDRIPITTEILMTHGPLYKILDKTNRGKHAGCRLLASKVDQLPACRLHVFGHIHEAFGALLQEPTSTGTGRLSVNAAMPVSKRAMVVDLQD